MNPQKLIKNILTNTSISWKAKGLFIFIINNPKIFKEIQTDKQNFILQNGKEGRDATRSGVKELIQNNILHRQYHRNNEPGRNYIIGTTWHLLGEK